MDRSVFRGLPLNTGTRNPTNMSSSNVEMLHGVEQGRLGVLLSSLLTFADSECCQVLRDNLDRLAPVVFGELALDPVPDLL